MRSLSLKLLASTMILNVSTLTYSSASESVPHPIPSLNPTETKIVIQALKSCDQAVTNAESTIKSQKDVIVKQDELITKDAKTIEELRQPPSILKSPILWGIIGVAIGGFVIHR